MTDNGPQFSSAEFVTFTKVWGFEHCTSSPHYPQSNGKVENAVKTTKRLFTKCRESGQSEYRALLDWRNTPTEGIGTSPAQRYFGRRCKTILPMTHSQLEPQYSMADDARALQGQKAKQQLYYDRSAKDLPPIHKGDVVQMRLPGQTTWTPAVCMGQCCPRSYRVKVDGREFRRNRRQLIQTSEQLPLEPAVIEQNVTTQPDIERETPTEQQVLEPPRLSEPESPSAHSAPDTGMLTPQSPRRSGRTRRPLEWLTNYVPS